MLVALQFRGHGGGTAPGASLHIALVGFLCNVPDFKALLGTALAGTLQWP